MTSEEGMASILILGTVFLLIPLAYMIIRSGNNDGWKPTISIGFAVWGVIVTIIGLVGYYG